MSPAVYKKFVSSFILVKNGQYEEVLLNDENYRLLSNQEPTNINNDTTRDPLAKKLEEFNFVGISTANIDNNKSRITNGINATTSTIEKFKDFGKRLKEAKNPYLPFPWNATSYTSIEEITRENFESNSSINQNIKKYLTQEKVLENKEILQYIKDQFLLKNAKLSSG